MTVLKDQGFGRHKVGQPGLIVFALFFAFLMAGCAGSDAIESLNTEIKVIESKIADAQRDLSKYGDGSPLHALVSLRLSTNEQTLAMLKQKWAALRWYPRFTYTVDGRPYAAPENVELKIVELQASLIEAQKKADDAALKAATTGGLLGVLAQVNSEITRLPVAQLEYQLLAYKHGFPAYIPNLKEVIPQP